MPRYIFVAYSQPAPGREQEFNEWYTNRHLPDLLAIPGVISGRRLKVCDEQIMPNPQPFQYLALYEVEADSPQAFFKELRSRLAPSSPGLLASSSVLLWESLSGG